MAVFSSLLGVFSLAMADEHDEHEDRDGYYFAAGLGTPFDTDVDFVVVGGPADRKGVLDIGNNGVPSFKVAVGKKIGNFRVETEVLWVSYGIDDATYSEIALPISVDYLNEMIEVSGNVGYTAFMGNVYYDIDTGTKWVPYVGAGAGVAKTKINTRVSLLGTVGYGTGSDIVPAAQVQAGIAYNVTKKAQIYGGYRYTRLGRSQITQASGSTIKSNPSNNSHYEAGVRYRWGGRRHRK